MRDRAMRLTVEDHRVHRLAYIVDAGVARNRHFAGFRFDFEFADGGAGGVGGNAADVVGSGGEEGAYIDRWRRRDKQVGEFKQIDRAVSADHSVMPVREMEVARRDFKPMCRDRTPLGDDLIGRLHEQRADQPHRSIGMRAAATGDERRVAVAHANRFERHAEAIGEHLREACLVALAA